MGAVSNYPVYDVYVGEREVWDEKKCAQIAKQRLPNGYGDRWPFPGLVQATGTAVKYYGYQQFNGCIEVDGKLYKATNRPWPKLPEEYCFVSIPTWGKHIYKRSVAEAEGRNITTLGD